MNIIELIGFIITLFAMVFLTGKRIREADKRILEERAAGHPNEEDEEQLRELLETLHIQQEEAAPPPPPPLPQAKAAKVVQAQPDTMPHAHPQALFAQPVPQRPIKRAAPLRKSKIEQAGPSKISQIINKLPSKKQLFILNEVLKRPEL